MVLRELNKDERELSEKQVKVLKREGKQLDFLERYNNMMLEEGCYWNYQSKLTGHEVTRSELKQEIKINETKLKVLQEQLEKGVEMKEKK